MRKIAFLLLLLPAPALGQDYARRTVLTKCAVPLGNGLTAVHGGSGTVVARDRKGFWVLTCRHCLEAGGACSVVLQDGTTLPAEYRKYYHDHDLALLHVDVAGKGDCPVEVAPLDKCDECAAGEGCVKCGHPGGGPLSVLRGPVHRTDARIRPCAQHPNGSDTWVLKISCRSGDSGGGLYRAATGTLIGVVWGSDGATSSAVPAADVRYFLKASGVLK